MLARLPTEVPMFRFPRPIARALLLLVLLASPASALAKGPKLAVVNVQKVMEASEHWKKAVAKLQKDRLEKQAALELKQKELVQKKEKLDAQRAVSDPASLSKQEEELYKDAQVLTEGYMRSQQDLTLKEKKVSEQMLARVEVVVRDLALEGGFDFVFETGTEEAPNVLYSLPTMDLTTKTIELYTKRFKDKPLEN